MAITTRDAAAHSERAADAARDATLVAQSQIRPEFRGRMLAKAQGDGHVACVQIKSVGDAVVVRRVTSLRSFRDLNGSSGPAELVREDLVPYNDESALPLRMRSGETILLSHPAMRDGGEPFVRFILDVVYGFDADRGAGTERRLIVSDTSW